MPSLAIGGNCRDIASCRSRLISRCGGTPVGPCPPTGHGGNSLMIGAGTPSSFVTVDGIAGSFNVSYYLSVQVYIRDIATFDVNTDFSIFSTGGFLRQGATPGQVVDAYVYVTDILSAPAFAWHWEYGKSGDLRDVLYPLDCAYHLAEGRYASVGAGPFYDREFEFRLDGVSLGTVTQASADIDPPSGFWLGTETGQQVLEPYYFDNVKFGTSWGAGDIFTSDFESGLGAFGTSGDVSIVASP